MIRNILAATLRNLARSKLYAVISIFGLAVGISAALIMTAVIRNQLSYDWLSPASERTYQAVSLLRPPGVSPVNYPMTNGRTAPLLKLTYPQIEAVTRIDDERLVLAHGDVRAKERIYWADTNFFDLFPFPVLSGDLATALARPDGLVMTRAMSRKYFGHDDSVGETLVIEPMTLMVVRAVIEDLPAGGTQFQSGIFVSGLAEAAPDYFRATDVNSGDEQGFGLSPLTFFRLAPGASIAPLSATMDAFYDRLLPRALSPTLRQSMNAAIELVRIDRVQLFPGLNPGAYERLIMAAIIGALVLFIACVNFVNLSTARAERRAVEVSIRKISGAARATLIMQFIGEAMVSVGLAASLGILLTAIVLPYVNALLDTGASLDLSHDPALILWLLLGTLALGTIAGAYPALVLASFRPVGSLKGLPRHSRGAIAVREVLVTVQFAMLIGLMIATAVVYRQREYAIGEALRANTDQMLVVNLRSPDGPLLGRCDRAFKNGIDALPGVRQAVCTSANFLNGEGLGRVVLKDGGELPIKMAGIQLGVFGLYGVKALAGDISAPSGVYDESVRQPRLYVVNETAALRLGYPTPESAIGQSISFPSAVGDPVTIVGVVPDFSLGYIAEEVDPVLYSHVVRPQNLDVLHIKLAGTAIPETLAAIDALWRALAPDEPIDRFFVDDFVQDLYRAVLRQAQGFAIFSGIALLLGCLGLIGLAASATELRTKEVGIRKATGAGSADILRLLNWEFAKPVLWANLIAWPIAYYAMQNWLEGFAYHIDLELWMFAVAGALALVIALVTVSVHSWLVACAKPVAALRYE